jgi:glycosyltransferase involved in cell wall biosynthesis
MKKPLVSIIVPAYNEEKYISSCLSSLISQSYENIEIILVDDGSNDSTVNVARKFLITVVKQSHKGLAASRNLGVSKSKGTILALLDADIRYDKRYIEKLIIPILEGKTVGTFNKEEYVANPDNIWSKCWSINAGMPYDRRLPKDYKDTADAFRAIKKDVYLKGKGLDRSSGYTEDSTLSRKLNILSINAPGAKSYHYNPSSLSEIYYSARWIGRSDLFNPTVSNMLRFSFVNSIRVGIKYLLKKAPVEILIFKIVFDFGMFSGIFLSGGKTSK